MVAVFSFSEVGGHDVNEDAFCVQAHPVDRNCWLCLLADGQGGRWGGGPASQRACQTALQSAFRCPPAKLVEPSIWSDIVRQADAAVAADTGAGFTTLVGLCVYGGRVVGASSGDSAALVFSGGKATRLTAGQQKNPPVGSGAAIAIPFAAALTEPWRVLTMSDGVWKYVGWERVVEVAKGTPGRLVIAELQEAARLPGNGQFPDDFTVVLLESPAES